MESDRRWQTVFEDRYGVDALDRLRAAFSQPCVTFAQIAQQFGVTRERVRQWHLWLMPDAPRGHARQQMCKVQRRKREVLTDPLFRSFYRHARQHFEPVRFELIPGRTGFHKRAVWLDRRLILLKKARPLRRPPGNAAYLLTIGPRAHDAAFVYYRLGEDDYLFVPRDAVSGTRAIVSEESGSAFERFHNTFAAAKPAPGSSPLIES